MLPKFASCFATPGRSKSFEEGGESFVLVAVVTDVTNPKVDEGATKERQM